MEDEGKSITDLPTELLLLVASNVDSRKSCIALCAVLPWLGLEALSAARSGTATVRLDQYEDPLLWLGVRLKVLRASESSALFSDGALLRRYAALPRHHVSDGGRNWLNAQYAAAGSMLRLCSTAEESGHLAGATIWVLRDGPTYASSSARVRWEWSAGTVMHYAGDDGAERMVRREWPGGMMEHYEGGRGAEHRVRTERPEGTVTTY